MEPLRKNPTTKIVILYMIVGLLWIFLSDAALALLLGDLLQTTLAQTIKGTAYVVVTGGLLHLVLQREFQKRHDIELQYYELFFANPMPIAIYHQATAQIIGVNQAMLDLYGYTYDEVILLHLGDLQIHQNNETLGKHKDGTFFPIELSYSDIHLDAQTMGMIVIMDIRDRRLMEHLERDLARERESRQLKNRFVSMFTHDFRTPLSTIMTSLGILERYADKLSPEDRDTKIQRIYHSIKQINQLLDDMMTFNQSEMGKVEFKPNTLNLETFCREILEIFKGERTIQFKMVEQTHIAWLDRTLMHYVLTNLLSNALKYSPPDKPVIFEVFGDENKIAFKIQDFGLGIPKNEQADIFKPFKRGSNAKHIQGTGLGLMIVKEYVEMHKGDISFESEEDQGTTFIVKIPCLTPATSEANSNLALA